MRKIIILAAMVTCSFTSHASQCNKWEYAKLKDASKKELSDLYCVSAQRAISSAKRSASRNEAASEATERGSLNQATKFLNEAHAISMEQVSCMEQLEDAETMLMKKFKAGPPQGCRVDYEKEVISKNK